MYLNMILCIFQSLPSSLYPIYTLNSPSQMNTAFPTKSPSDITHNPNHYSILSCTFSHYSPEWLPCPPPSQTLCDPIAIILGNSHELSHIKYNDVTS